MVATDISCSGYEPIVKLLQNMKVSVDRNGDGVFEQEGYGAKTVIRYPFDEQLFKDTLAHTNGYDLFAYPYDWRKSIDEPATNLNRTIDAILRETRAAKVDIIAHSQGGLVTRYCVNLVENCGGKIRKIILMAPVLHGSPKSYIALHPLLSCLAVNPWDPRNKILCNKKYSKVASTLPSVFQLLPTKRWFEVFGNRDNLFIDQFPPDIRPFGYFSTREKTYLGEGVATDGDGVLANESLVRKAFTFHDTMGSGIGCGTNGCNLDGEVFVVSGAGLCTPQGITKVPPPWWEPLDRDGHEWEIALTNGDATLPLASADNLFAGSKSIIRRFYVHVEHGDVPKFGGTHDLIAKVLTKDSSVFGKREFTPSEYGQLDDKGVITDINREGDRYEKYFRFKASCNVYRIGSPIELHIKTPQGEHVGPIQIQNISDLIESQSGYNYFVFGDDKVAIVPGEGIYELTFQGTGTGTFGLEVTQIGNDKTTGRVMLPNMGPISPASKGILMHDSSAPLTSIELKLDIDGDGIYDKVYRPIFSENFENGPNGWKAKSHWHLTEKSSCAATNTPFPSPLTAWYFGLDATCNVKVGGGELTSPMINIPTGTTKVFASFNYFLNLATQPGKAVVFASFNKGKKQQIWSGSTAKFREWASSSSIGIDVPKRATSMRLHFIVYTLPKGLPPATGWFIDDVNVCAGTGCEVQIMPSSSDLAANNSDELANDGIIEFQAQGSNIQSTRVEIFSLTGERLFNSGYVLGNTVRWQATDSRGQNLANGVYLYVLTTRTHEDATSKSEIRKLVLKR
jgi:hypothetical protein